MTHNSLASYLFFWALVTKPILLLKSLADLLFYVPYKLPSTQLRTERVNFIKNLFFELAKIHLVSIYLDSLLDETFTWFLGPDSGQRITLFI